MTLRRTGEIVNIDLKITCPICKKKIYLSDEIAHTKKGAYHLECYPFLTEEQKECITIGELARLSMISICIHYFKRKNLSKDDFFKLIDKENKKLKEYLKVK